MKDNELNQKCNLLSKLKSRLTPAKIVKSIAGLAIATSMLFTTFACTNSNNTTNSSTGSSTNQEQSSSSSQNEKYSKLITNILSNSYYNQLLSMAKEDETYYSSAYFDPHPYTFLEDEGFDTDKIKSGELYCRTQSFVKDDEPKNLYVATYVENKAGNYYHQYMLKYTLSEQEMKDYDMLHQNRYIHAVFANNEISKMKDPEIISEEKIDINTHKSLCEAYNKFSKTFKLGCDFIDILVKSHNQEDYLFELHIIPRENPTNIMKDIIQYGITKYKSISLNVENDILLTPTNFNSIQSSELNTYKTTHYNTQFTNLNHQTQKNLTY